MVKGLEIPLGKRSRQYRFFEMLPALISYGAIILLIALSIYSPVLAALYMLLIATTVLVKAVLIAFHMIQGRLRVSAAEKVDWATRLHDLESPQTSLKGYEDDDSASDIGGSPHLANLQRLATLSDIHTFPKPSELYNAVIVATYNEPFEVLEGTIDSLHHTTYNSKQLIVFLAYEERGGPDTETTAERLKERFKDTFFAFETVQHPANLPNELIGKGGNITYAGHALQAWLDTKAITYDKVIVTTLDSDNRPHRTYFDYVSYEYIMHPNRKKLSFQPVSLFLNNIWDVPAPMRVVATGNSFWNIISAVRPHTLRNFASHSQPMDALVEMDFWSTKTIVEDGHQYWRSYFHFNGDYAVLPIFVPIYQDAVMSDTYVKTLKAQFVQLRRWAYGASDVPYVAVQIFTKKRKVPLFPALARLFRLLDGHVTLACLPLLITFGGYIPHLINNEAARSVAANQLPEVLGVLQRIAMIGLIITIFLTFKMLPARPERYKRRRTLWMVLQWVLMPVTAICYSAASAYYSQTRLLFARYFNTFDVTEKATVVSVEQAKSRKRARLGTRKAE